MSQQINLVNPALLPPKPFFQFQSMALALAVLACVLAAFSALILSRVSTYEQSAALTAQRLQVETAQVAALEQKSGKPEVSPRLVEEQSAVLAERQRLDMLAGQIGQISGGQPVRSRAAVFYALAERKADGLWLTGVDVQGDHIGLEGMALDARHIPVWLAGLRESPVFAGQRFGGLEITPVAADPASTASAATTLAFRLTAVPASRTHP